MTYRILAALATFALLSSSLFANPKQQFEPSISINPENIEIVRDSFGVPHIFAPTDAEVAYGLAWATAEDDVENSQFLLLAVKGVLGKHLGVEGAKIDYAVQFLGIRDFVNEHYDEAVSDDFKKVLEGYCMGANAYFEAHPEKVWVKSALPIVPQDLVGGYMLGLSLLAGVEGAITDILDGDILEQIPEKIDIPGIGSNSWAMNSAKTTTGNTYLAVNAHQPVEGLLSWYEASLHSEEGWNIVGALFHGSVSILLGTNDYLGWAHTTGQLDQLDVYVLEMHPTKKDYYKYDGEWLKLETKHAKLKVGIGKNKVIKLPIRKKYWMSVYGPTLKTDHGVFAVKTPAIEAIKAAEQWFQMNKAQNFSQFKQTLEMRGLSMYNISYADKYDTIFFIANGVVPERAPGYNWKKVLPGNTSTTNWTNILPLDSMCYFLNPECGWVFNTNNAGFEATSKAENKQLSDFNPYIGYREEINNRSLRTYEIMESYEGQKMTYEDFKALKFDYTYPDTPIFRGDFYLNEIYTLSPQEYPHIADAIAKWKAFDHSADKNDPNAALVVYTIYEMLDQDGKWMSKDSIRENSENQEAFVVHCIKNAQNKMLKLYGTLDIPLGEVQVVKRGDKELPLDGAIDVLRMVIAKPMKDGRFKMWVGDTYVQLVQFTDDGPIIEAINVFGASSNPESEHYDDQMDLHVNYQMIPRPLDKESIMKMAMKVYHPM